MSIGADIAAAARDVAVAAAALLAGLASGGASLLVVRTYCRRRRTMSRYFLMPDRCDEGREEAVRALLAAWHQVLLEPWWQRPSYGQLGMTLEIAAMDDGHGGIEGHLLLGLPERHVAAFKGALLGCYPDCRLTPLETPFPDIGAVVRLKKRHTFIRAPRTADIGEKQNVVDALLSQMERLGKPSCVQIALVPAPPSFHHWARSRYRQHERTAAPPRLSSDGRSGERSEVIDRELERGVALQHRTPFFADIRVGGASFEHCYAIAATLRAETSAENRLVIRQLRARSALYRARLLGALSNPIPDLRRGVFSAPELAALWHMLSPGLTTVSVRPTPVPRAVASSAISRDPAHALMCDERGAVGILACDKSDGLGLIGGQKTGKTSVLCQSVRADSLDEDCAVVVLMPKPGDALAALSMVPPHRTVHFLDFQSPGFGINPLLAQGDASMVADQIVEAFRDVVAERDIHGSSDRYLRQSAQATIAAGRAGALSEPPSLWHIYRMLLPSETAFREHVVNAIDGDPRFVDTATFFGRDLPNDLRDALVNTTSKLDAPRNKILRLLVESLDKVLRHPIQLSLDELVRKREVLVVDGKIGTFGSDNCRVMMQFILSMLYGALHRQQQLSEAKRVRVALKVDDAHLIINPSFADALATLRPAGLEVVAAWQYGAQIEDPKFPGGMMNLLRQRCMFSMGEAQDAHEMSDIAMSVYVDVVRDGPDADARLRRTPDVFMNLPNHHALCCWISGGGRVPAFLGQTIPMDVDERRIEGHLERQAQRGCYVPDRLSSPLPALGVNAERESPGLELIGAPSSSDGLSEVPSALLPLSEPASSPPRPGVPRLPHRNGRSRSERYGDENDDPNANRPPAPPHESAENGATPGSINEARETQPPAAAPPDKGGDKRVRRLPANRRSAEQPPPPGPVPDSYTELDLDNVRGISWDRTESCAPEESRDGSDKELEILVSLWEHRHLFASQIHRRWWPTSTLRACQKTLTRMAQAGWVARFRFLTSEPGTQQWVYCLTEQGFRLAQTHASRGGPRIDSEATWSAAPSEDANAVLRDLHVNGWVLALHELGPRRVRDWRGPARSKLVPPRRKERNEWVDVRPSHVPISGGRQLRDVAGERLESVNPAATVELRLGSGDAAVRLDLLIDLDRSRGAAFNERKLRRYDAFLAGWHQMLERYRELDPPPVVVFVCQDVRQALAYVRTADRVVTARLARTGDPEEEWPYPSRRQMLFVCERDIHMRSLAALALPELPPSARIHRKGPEAARVRPKRVELVRLVD